MAKYPGLVQRGKRGTYWFRRRIPHELVRVLGIGLEINKSLGTRDYDEAVERWGVEDKKARDLFARGTSDIAANEPTLSLKEACEIFYQHQLQIEREYRQRVTKTAFEDPGSLAKLIDLPDAPKDPTYLATCAGTPWHKLAVAFRESTQVLLDHAKLSAVILDTDRYEAFARDLERVQSAQDERRCHPGGRTNADGHQGLPGHPR